MTELWAQQGEELLRALKLDVRMNLAFALLLITLIGLVLVVGITAGAQAIRRMGKSNRNSKTARPHVDDWARRPLVRRWDGRTDEP